MVLEKCTVLFAEDNRDAQEQIKLFLEDDIAMLYQAYDGQKAWELYLEHRPDIVLTDISMPFLNGLELSRMIREKNPDQMIIMLSARDEKEMLAEAMRAGIEGFVSKPVHLKQLFEELVGAARKIEDKE